MFRTANERSKVAQAAAQTDLYQLWKLAFDRYNKNVGNKVSIKALPRVQSLSGVISQVDEAAGEFSWHRNNKSRLARLRTAVGDYLGLAKSVGDLIVGSAVASFPPAAAIWTVATYAIKTAQTQRQDYDKLTDLFTETGGFLKVVQIIELALGAGNFGCPGRINGMFTLFLSLYGILYPNASTSPRTDPQCRPIEP